MVIRDINHVVISLGSNTPDCSAKVAEAIKWLSTKIIDAKASHCYSTPSMSGKGPNYTNAVVEGLCKCSMTELNVIFKRYEVECGRTAEMRAQGLVPIDLDIVIWNGAVERTKDHAQDYFQRGWRELW